MKLKHIKRSYQIIKAMETIEEIRTTFTPSNKIDQVEDSLMVRDDGSDIVADIRR